MPPKNLLIHPIEFSMHAPQPRNTQSPEPQFNGQHTPELSRKARLAAAQKATWISAGVNLGLTLAQLLVGWLAHSQSLIAHGLHSFSDLLSDFLVLFANRQGHHPADDAHPYGHARVETAATLILGASLIAVGIGILWDGIARLPQVDHLPPLELAALWVAIGTVLAKEGLYRYLIAVAERLRSQLMVANALHTRADAASALVVVVGVGGSLMGWTFLDLIAAILMGFMILKLGGELAWQALQELIDTGLDEREVESIRETLESIPGVVGAHDLRTRRMAHRALVDAHVQVDPRISVSEGHRIAEEARARVLLAHRQILDVLVHIDAEEDGDEGGGVAASEAEHPPAAPLRSDLREELTALFAGQPAPDRLVLHYLRGRVEVEAHFSSALPDPSATAEISRRADASPVFSRVKVLHEATHQNRA
jgi:cation diffusion facilitator family transporter